MICISLTVWREARDTLDLELIPSEGDTGGCRYIIQDRAKGENRRRLSDEESNRLRALLDFITVTVMFQSIPRMTGTSYMLRVNDVSLSAQYNWGQETPKGWEGLQELAELIIEIAGSSSA